jgi:hypothetical protein
METPYDADMGRSYPAATSTVVRRVSWGAVFAGALVAMVATLILNLLGLAIGAAAVDPGEAGGLGALGIGATIWLILTTIIAMFGGGWVAGHLAGVRAPLDSSLHGLVAFSVATLVTFFVLTATTGAALTGASAAIAGILNMGDAGRDPRGAIYAVPRDQMRGGPVSLWLEEQGIRARDPRAEERIALAAGDYVQALVFADDRSADRYRQVLVETIAANTDLSEREAERRVARLEMRAEHTGRAAARGVAGASFGTFFTLLLGAAAAMGGACLAALRPAPPMPGRREAPPPPTAVPPAL